MSESTATVAALFSALFASLRNFVLNIPTVVIQYLTNKERSQSRKEGDWMVDDEFRDVPPRSCSNSEPCIRSHRTTTAAKFDPNCHV
jgi:hypothetical protein